MTDSGSATTAARAPRWMVTAFVASLALNLVVVGLIGGAAMRRPVAQGVTPNLLGFASTLPAERRKELWQRTVEERRLLRPLRREVRAAREAALGALVMEPFDRQRYLAAQTHQAQAEERARPAVHTLYAVLAEQLTAEERRDFRRWRDRLRPPGHNLLDEPDLQASELLLR